MSARSSLTTSPRLAGALISLLLGCFALVPKADAVTPAPDGGYPGGNTAEGTQALLSLTSGAYNTALGQQALFRDTTGSYNTAEGFRALFNNSTGFFNTATGVNALYSNTTGRNNEANGYSALFHNTTGNSNAANGTGALFSNTIGGNNVASGSNTLYSNATGLFNVANGSNALFRNTTGSNNTGDGTLALYNNTTGSGNIALGRAAGYNLTVGNNNIDIGNVGIAGESGTIRIGTDGTHTDTFLAGVVHSNILGVGTTPETTLHVRGTGTSAAAPAGHVALIKENSAFAHVLALQSGWPGTHSATDNFITFFNAVGSSLGAIEGNGAGSIQLAGAGSDYAEYLPKDDPSAEFAATEIVGVRDGRIVARGADADQFMVVTGQALVAGNRPSEDEADLARRSLVAFIGQVPVKVRGPVKSGDFILAAEKDEGTGIAMPAAKIAASAMHRVVGRAWDASAEEGLKTVNAAVGLDQNSLMAPILERLEHENQELRTANAALAQKLEALVAQQEKVMETVVARLEEQELQIQKVSKSAPQVVADNR